MYLGIDVASIDDNKHIDWVAARAAGCQYAIIRGTFKTWADPTWSREADRARAAGLTVGAYLFPVMNEGAPAPEQQVAAFRQAVGLLSPKDFPPALDVEFGDGVAATGRTRRQLLAWTRAAVAALKRTYGVPPIIYTSARVWDGEDSDSLDVDGLGVPTPELVECPLWLARYPYKRRIEAVIEPATVDSLRLPPVPKTWVDSTNVWIHQYQGDAKKLSGFDSIVDLNRFFDLRRGAKGERVRWLQRKLDISVDGDFGVNTREAVIRFQREHQLRVDGVVGPKTFARLCWTA